jgi:hypothetical protein
VQPAFVDIASQKSEVRSKERGEQAVSDSQTISGAAWVDAWVDSKVRTLFLGRDRMIETFCFNAGFARQPVLLIFYY